MEENGGSHQQYAGGVVVIGIYFICFIIFPVSVFINCHKSYSVNKFLDRQDTNVVKGIATCLVILAHLTTQLDNVNGYASLLNIFSMTGGMGVLLFFFVSGYGLYKSYETKKMDIGFWKKRIINMYLPCVLIQFIFTMIMALMKQAFNVQNMVFDSLFGAWFIDVILVQYAIFFIMGKIANGKSDVWIVLSFAGSLLAALVFWKSGLNARWYNGLLLFPFGMLIAHKEEKIIAIVKQRSLVLFIMSIFLFGVSGAFFTLFKEMAIGIGIVKTFAGMCLCMVVCIAFSWVKFGSWIMSYIGKRSLYFYLVHLNLLTILGSVREISRITIFYIVLILTVPIVEVFYRLRKKNLAA